MSEVLVSLGLGICSQTPRPLGAPLRFTVAQLLLAAICRRSRRRRDKRKKMTGRAKRKSKSTQVFICTVQTISVGLQICGAERQVYRAKTVLCVLFDGVKRVPLNAVGRSVCHAVLSSSGQTTTWQQLCGGVPLTTHSGYIPGVSVLIYSHINHSHCL